MNVDFSEYWYFEQFDVLDTLTDSEKKTIIQMSCRTNHPKKSIIYSTKDKSDRLYFLKKGSVKISKYSESGKEMIISILREGDVFGESSLIFGPEGYYQEVAEVMEDVLTCSLSIPDVKKILSSNIEFSKSITNLIGFKYKKMQNRLESLFFKSTPERIKGFIKEMADDYGTKLLNSDEIEVKLTLKHEDIAKLTGTTRQTVSSVMSDLDKLGVISYDRSRILIRDYKKLA
jgi:CRP-like cAMP-binding protein